MLAILKGLKRGDENELERKLRLETATRRLRRQTKKKNRSGEDGSYRTAQVSHGDGRRKKSKMVATTQLRLAPETEDERRARLEYLSDNPIYIPNNLLYLILIVAF